MSNQEKVAITLAIIILIAIISIGFFSTSRSEAQSVTNKDKYKVYRATFVDNPSVTTNVIAFNTDTLLVGDTIIAEWNPEHEYNIIRFDLIDIPPTMNTRIYKVIITD